MYGSSLRIGLYISFLDVEMVFKSDALGQQARRGLR